MHSEPQVPKLTPPVPKIVEPELVAPLIPDIPAQTPGEDPPYVFDADIEMKETITNGKSEQVNNKEVAIQPEKPPLKENEWECGFCTFINEYHFYNEKSFICIMCY